MDGSDEGAANVRKGPDQVPVDADDVGVTGPDVPEQPVVTHAPAAPRQRRRLRRGYQALAILAVLGLAPSAFVRTDGGARVRSVADVPAEPVGIVFGAGVVGDSPSPYLASRLDVALALWRAHKIKVFLVTGDNSVPDYNEPRAMRDYLEAHGVPADLIVLDYAGFDTWESCARAKQIFGVDHAVVVSQAFHVPRAVYLCRAAGIDAYGVGDGSRAWGLSPAEYVHDSAREVAAGVNALYQASFTPAPTFLGGRESGVADALRAAAAR